MLTAILVAAIATICAIFLTWECVRKGLAHKEVSVGLRVGQLAAAVVAGAWIAHTVELLRAV